MTTTVQRLTILSELINELQLCKDPELRPWVVSYLLHLDALEISFEPTVSSPVILASHAQTWNGSRNSSRSLCP